MGLLACLLLALSGCGGSKTEQNTVFVDGGASTARVANDRKQKITVKDNKGVDHIEERNIGGMIVMPKPTYDELRRGYLANSTHPATPANAPVELPLKTK